MIVELLTERHLEFLSLKGGRTGSSESTHVKMSNCWKSHAAAHFLSVCQILLTLITEKTDLDDTDMIETVVDKSWSVIWTLTGNLKIYPFTNLTLCMLCNYPPTK